MKVILMSGIPGSGKSTYVNKLIREDPDSKFCICSTNHYFQRDSYGRYDQDATYNFDQSLMAEANGYCLKKFIEEIVPGSKRSSWADTIVVDNTNGSVMELAPYVQIAMAYNIPVEIVTLHCDPYVGAERNLHGASYSTCSLMNASIKNRAIPNSWSVKMTNVDEGSE